MKKIALENYLSMVIDWYNFEKKINGIENINNAAAKAKEKGNYTDWNTSLAWAMYLSFVPSMDRNFINHDARANNKTITTLIIRAGKEAFPHLFIENKEKIK